MARNSRGKRPCCICRKWFLPDVRQKGRQKTCSPDCKNERHRRQCEAWNKKNKAYFKNDYLGKKLEKNVNQQTASASRKISLTSKTKPVLPIEIIATEYGIKPAIIIQYLATQIVNQSNGWPSGFS